MQNPATISNYSARAGVDWVQSGPRRPGEGEFNFAARVQPDAAGPRDAIFLVFDARDARSESGPWDGLQPRAIEFERARVIHEQHEIDVGTRARFAASIRPDERKRSNRVLAARPGDCEFDDAGRTEIL